ncbi:Holliday junction DNA helicase RuvA [Lachnospiraceae bacterium PF1-21]|uniref:Holliday junction branch migration complex subunit RuvA n=1 Tax=Ohessyouella blattaphilus TaxID=2949333 RepID=A0ABT1EF71_9FIRM|nr:Holliday junction branch migration protein RuvA [Ohessyouella blattaphilus]MCP1109288.1 Holliday junction branch migration protein RuvA [Ohessyouella blattaphilus]MCR8562682.1 Holliday junction branch migration protein RuvA [Ohessyouella blattaphilus]
MINYIKGDLVAVYDGYVVIENGGIGYGLFMANEAISRLGGLHDEVKVHTYLNVKEDAMQLFGFLTRDDLDIFKLLIGVSGIGPKGGLAILSIMTPDELRFAIIGKDAKAIAKAPGVGKKTAEKLIIELADKVNIEDTLRGDGDVDFAVSSDNEKTAEAVQALVALGYGNSEALKAVKKVANADELEVEALLKLALKNIIG